jgi:hypothetical protein
MWRVRHVLIAAAVVGVAIALSACGGDSSPEQQINVPTETQASQGKTEFIAQADSVCAEANSSIEQFAASGQGLSEADQIAQLRQGVVEQIRQLNPPSDTNLDAFLQGMEAQAAAGEKIGLALQRGEDTTQFETELDTAKSQAEQAAAAYGFQECGQPISSSGTAPSTGAPSSDSASSGAVVTPTEPSTAAPPSSDGSGGTGSGTDSGSTGAGTPDTGSGTGSGTGGTGGNSGGIGPG